MTKHPVPGISRNQRVSDEGLARLEKQLQSGIKINTLVLREWVKRYGAAANNLLKKYGYELDD